MENFKCQLIKYQNTEGLGIKMKGKSKIYGIILVVIIMGYVFFFFSPFIFHNNRSFLLTPIGTTQKLSDQVELTLKRWAYSKAEKSMTVMFSATNQSLNRIALNWSTAERHTTKFLNIDTGSSESKLKTDVKYPFENMVIVMITGVPAEFEEVALTLQLDSLDDSTSKNKLVSFYTNKNDVEYVEKIGNPTNVEYRIEYLKIQANDKKQRIQELQDENDTLTQDNLNYRKTIQDLLSNQEYETTEEIKSSDSRIQAYQKQISTNEDTIKKNKYEIIELENTISEINQAIEKQESQREENDE